jgi:hypothetical protein
MVVVVVAATAAVAAATAVVAAVAAAVVVTAVAAAATKTVSAGVCTCSRKNKEPQGSFFHACGIAATATQSTCLFPGTVRHIIPAGVFSPKVCGDPSVSRIERH